MVVYNSYTVPGTRVHILSMGFGLYIFVYPGTRVRARKQVEKGGDNEALGITLLLLYPSQVMGPEKASRVRYDYILVHTPEFYTVLAPPPPFCFDFCDHGLARRQGARAEVLLLLLAVLPVRVVRAGGCRTAGPDGEPGSACKDKGSYSNSYCASYFVVVHDTRTAPTPTSGSATSVTDTRSGSSAGRPRWQGTHYSDLDATRRAKAALLRMPRGAPVPRGITDPARRRSLRGSTPRQCLQCSAGYTTPVTRTRGKACTKGRWGQQDSSNDNNYCHKCSRQEHGSGVLVAKLRCRPTRRER